MICVLPLAVAASYIRKIVSVVNRYFCVKSVVED